MNKTYLIFRHEFLQTVKKTGWFIMTMIVPALALLGIGAMALLNSGSDSSENSIEKIGYLDEAGIIGNHDNKKGSFLLPFANAEEAKQALAESKISEYIIIPSDFSSKGIIQRYTLEKELTTSPITVAIIKNFLTRNLLIDKVPQSTVELIISPLNLQVTRITEQGEIKQKQGNKANIIIPGIFALLLSLALMIGATTLISGLGEEKESRLIEILFSAVSVRQLLIGKVLALGTAGLLQVLVWLLSAPFLLKLAINVSGGSMSGIEIPPGFMLLGIIYFILGYLLFAVLSIGVGAISSNAKEGSQISMAYTLVCFIPLWFMALFMIFPNSSIWVILTLFPITAPIQTMLRLGVSEIPLWQLISSIGLLIISIIGGLYLSIKLFRMNMLMHGKKPTIKEIISNLKKA